MKKDANNLHKKAEELFDGEKYDDIINLLTNKVLETHKDSGLYVRRGFSWYCKKDYDKAIADYDKALEINPNYELAFYNRGHALIAKRKYVDAIADFDKVIESNPYYPKAYVSMASIWRVMEDYDKAIADYNKALEIDPNDANAYYYRGLAKKEKNVDLVGSKQDFEKYLKLNTDENDNGAKYAKYYLKKIDETNDKKLSVIADLVSKIKEILYLNEDCITHYTSLSVLKSLILDCSKFQISEGNFMADSSEGIPFFNFLYDNMPAFSKVVSTAESFIPKPFIGSFVAKEKYDDLTLWRLYGKEKGEEAKGCAITLQLQKFIEDIKNFLSNEKNKEARLDDESDINFYQVAYLNHASNNFYIPNSTEKSLELTELMTELKTNVDSYKGDNIISLQEYLNSIAFLFKSDAYKNEDEVRLVMNGIEFEKKYNMGVSSPRVYIELVSIKDIVSQIILGPKVDKGSEWIAAFHYRYEKSAPEIKFSHHPFK